jgi:hypothetical protein
MRTLAILLAALMLNGCVLSIGGFGISYVGVVAEKAPGGENW